VGGARIRREGKDAVILTWGPLVPAAIDAANALNDDDIATAVVDLRWLNPLDMQTIDRIVRASEGRVLVAHEANVTGGFGAEVAARVQEHHFDYLDAPVRRVGVPDSRIPSAPALQRALIPDAEGIATAVRTLVNG
jgi:pyruvate/2-oxoglutarate/acetoin dehydrogenase E1 component